MGRILLWASVIALLAAIGCDSRTLSGPRPPGTQAGPRNFGFFPSFAATIPRVVGRYNPQPPSRKRRSAGPGPATSSDGNTETDVLEVEDFLARNRLEGQGDVEEDKGLEGGSEDANPSSDNRLKRQDEEVKDNNLSWLLEQDLWEKVDDGDDLDWDNITQEEFEAADEAPSMNKRDTGGVGGESRVSEDAVYQRLLKLAEELEKRKKERELENQVAGEGGIEVSDVGSEVKHSDERDSPRPGVSDIEGDYVDDSLRRRRRSVDSGASVVRVEGHIDLFFKSAADNPVATVIIQKDPAPANPPEVPPPIYFCGTKTDPSNPDSVSGEISETVLAH